MSLRSMWGQRGSSHRHRAIILLNNRGVIVRLLRPLFRLVDQSWQMLPVGFLFGLGFDTVTEVSLLTVAATEASKGMPVWSILAFPALFLGGHVAHRHNRSHSDAGRLWLGVRQADRVTSSFFGVAADRF